MLMDKCLSPKQLWKTACLCLLITQLFLIRNSSSSIHIDFSEETIAGGNLFGYTWTSGQASTIHPEILYLATTNQIHMFNQTNGESIGVMGCLSKELCRGIDRVGIEVVIATQFYYSVQSFHVWEDLKSGNRTIYICGTKQIVKVDNDGIVSVFAGVFGSFERGDGGLATKAMFSSISSMWVDSNGIVYICDSNDNTIRRIGLNGIISTIAGADQVISNIKKDGFANESILASPMKIDGIDNHTLYVIDSFSTFKIDLSSGWLTVLSGSSMTANNEFQENGSAVNASLRASGMIANRDGSVLLSIQRKVLKISQDNTISTFVDFSSTFSLEISLFSPNYVLNSNLVAKFNVLGGELTLLFDSYLGPLVNRLNGRLARFVSISAITFNETSRILYISDQPTKNRLSMLNVDSNEMTRITLTQKLANQSCTNAHISTNTVSNIDNPTCLLLENNDLYISSVSGTQTTLQKIELQRGSNCFYGGSVSGDRLITNRTASSIVLNNPSGVHCGTIFKLIYIADTENHRILAYDPETLLVTLISGTGSPGFGGDGGLAINAQLTRPHSVFYDYYEDSIYIADTGNNRIRIINADGIISTLAGTGFPGYNGENLNPLQTQLNYPKFVMNSRIGVIFSDTNNHRVRIIPITNTSTVSTLIGTGFPGMKIVENSARDSELNSPVGLYIFRPSMTDNDIYIADSLNHRIIQLKYKNSIMNNHGIMNSDALVSTFAGNTVPGYNGDGIHASSARLFYPSSVTYVQGKGFVITDTYNNRIRLVQKSGYISTLVSSGINFPLGVCYGELGIVFSDSLNNFIRNKDLGKIVGGIGDGLNVFYSDINPTRMVKTADMELILSESNSNRIRLVNKNGITKTIAGTGEFGYKDGAIPSLIASPTGLSICPITNDIYFCDSGNNRIRKLTKTIDYYTVSTIAGTGEDGYNEETDPLLTKFSIPRSLGFMNNGDLVIGDTLNNLIRIISRKDRKIRTARKLSSVYTLTDMYVTEENVIFLSFQDSITKLTPHCKDGYWMDSTNSECFSVCFGIPENDTRSCQGHGVCTHPNICKCQENYMGSQCEIPKCYGIVANDSSVCSNNGSCSAPNSCQCNEGYYGTQCENAICFSKFINESCGGSERGLCTARNQCSCKGFFIGNECEHFTCSGINDNDPNVCNGRGTCQFNGECTCRFGYSGNDCQDVGQMIGFIVSFIVVFFLCIALVFATVCFSSVIVKKNRTQRRIIEVDLALDERLITNSYRLESSEEKDQDDDFIIPLHKLGMDKPVKKLGEGGAGSVFQTTWSGMTVAVKVFDLNNANISEEDFRVEAILLSKLRHPNIINFYGVSTSPTKRFIVMECLDMSLDKFILKLESKSVAIPLVEKLKMLISIAYGVEYLHNLKPRKIIHRDLKPQNILMDSNENCKVCDFGLSRLLSQGTKNSITNNIGSVFYMSPEMNDVQSINPEHATAVDIYSMSIIMWQLLFEIRDPFMSGIPSVLEKLGLVQKPEYMSPYKLSRMVCEKGLRPIVPFDSLDSCEEWCENYMEDESGNFAIVFELSQLIQKCWDHDPKERPSIEQVVQQLSGLEQELLDFGSSE